jgi:predicted branched-subunit amino acid permease
MRWSRCLGYCVSWMAGTASAMRAGLGDAAAFVPSVFVLGTIFGASAGPAGIGPVSAIAMSLLVFSGASQFAALPLWQQGGPIIVLTAFALSLRFSLMTASLAPRLAECPTWLKALLAFAITDENYALAARHPDRRVEPAYLVGVWLGLYVGWAAGTIVGVVLGAQVPEPWMRPLNAVFPIVFLTLTILCCTSRIMAVVAVLGGILSILGAQVLPPGWNVILAAIVASLIGAAFDRRGSR